MVLGGLQDANNTAPAFNETLHMSLVGEMRSLPAVEVGATAESPLLSPE